jgi:hypothetical protein
MVARLYFYTPANCHASLLSLQEGYNFLRRLIDRQFLTTYEDYQGALRSVVLVRAQICNGIRVHPIGFDRNECRHSCSLLWRSLWALLERGQTAVKPAYIPQRPNQRKRRTQTRVVPDQYASKSRTRRQYSSARPSGLPSCCHSKYARSRRC